MELSQAVIPDFFGAFGDPLELLGDVLPGPGPGLLEWLVAAFEDALPVEDVVVG